MRTLFEREDGIDRVAEKCGFGKSGHCLGSVVREEYLVRWIKEKDCLGN